MWFLIYLVGPSGPPSRSRTTRGRSGTTRGRSRATRGRSRTTRKKNQNKQKVKHQNHPQKTNTRTHWKRQVGHQASPTTFVQLCPLVLTRPTYIYSTRPQAACILQAGMTASWRMEDAVSAVRCWKWAPQAVCAAGAGWRAWAVVRR